MGKINNKDLYPLVDSDDISFSDFLIGSLANGKTRTFGLSAVSALLSQTLTIKELLEGAEEYQNDAFKGAEFVYGFAMGQEVLTGGLVENFDPSTGTVTLSDGFTPFTGIVIFVRVADSSLDVIDPSDPLIDTVTISGSSFDYAAFSGKTLEQVKKEFKGFIDGMEVITRDANTISGTTLDFGTKAFDGRTMYIKRSLE